MSAEILYLNSLFNNLILNTNYIEQQTPCEEYQLTHPLHECEYLYAKFGLHDDILGLVLGLSSTDLDRASLIPIKWEDGPTLKRKTQLMCDVKQAKIHRQ
jgi:hypothetical protein